MFEKIRRIISEQLDIPESEIEEESSFKDDLSVDSLDLYELIMAVESEYDVEIPAEDMGDVETVGDFIEYLESHGITE